MKKKKEIKVKKLSKEEYKIKFLQMNLEHKEQVYETFLKVLVKYHIAEVAYSAIGADELYHNALRNRMQYCIKNKKSFMNEMFGTRNISKKEQIESEIKYLDNLIDLARHKIEGFDDKTKMKIAKDAVEKMHLWLTTPSDFDRPRKDKSKITEKKNEL